MDIPVRVTDELTHQLKALRKLRGLSQAELGKRVGVGQTRIAEIEAKPGLVSTEQLVRVLKALGAELVMRTGDHGATRLDLSDAAPRQAPVGEARGGPARDPRRTPGHKGSW